MGGAWMGGAWMSPVETALRGRCPFMRGVGTDVVTLSMREAESIAAKKNHITRTFILQSWPDNVR